MQVKNCPSICHDTDAPNGHNLRYFLCLLPTVLVLAFPPWAELILLLPSIKRVFDRCRRLWFHFFLVPQALCAAHSKSGLGLFILPFSSPKFGRPLYCTWQGSCGDRHLRKWSTECDSVLAQSWAACRPPITGRPPPAGCGVTLASVQAEVSGWGLAKSSWLTTSSTIRMLKFAVACLNPEL